jgi:hypothetical protein
MGAITSWLCMLVCVCVCVNRQDIENIYFSNVSEDESLHVWHANLTL